MGIPVLAPVGFERFNPLTLKHGCQSFMALCARPTVGPISHGIVIRRSMMIGVVIRRCEILGKRGFYELGCVFSGYRIWTKGSPNLRVPMVLQRAANRIVAAIVTPPQACGDVVEAV
jgi:hypothetical protein